MEYGHKEKIKLANKGKIHDLHEIIRHRVHKDLKEVLPDLEDFADKHNGYAGVDMEEWPVRYLIGDNEIIVVMSILDESFEAVSEVMAFRFPKDDLDKLLE